MNAIKANLQKNIYIAIVLPSEKNVLDLLFYKQIQVVEVTLWWWFCIYSFQWYLKEHCKWSN